MGGSKSSSSTAANTTSSQDVLSADGFLLDSSVLNLSSTGGSVNLTQNFPSGVQQMTQSLIDLLGNTITGAGSITQEALATVTRREQEAAQPDLTMVKYTPLLIGGVIVLAGLALFWGRKK